MIVPAGMEAILERFRYAPGVMVDERTLYVSGQVGRDEQLRVVAEPEAQYERCFENVGKVLAAAGFDFCDVVELYTWHVEFPGDLALFMSVKDRWIKGPVYPTWTGFGVKSFSTPGLLCEVKVTAVRGGAGPGRGA